MIILKDVPFTDLQGIVEFIYHGEVSVDHKTLPSFLKTAQTLKVKGLTEDTDGAVNKSASSSTTSGGRPHSHHPRKSSKPKRSLPFLNVKDESISGDDHDRDDHPNFQNNHGSAAKIQRLEAPAASHLEDGEEEIDDVEEDELEQRSHNDFDEGNYNWKIGSRDF